MMDRNEPRWPVYSEEEIQLVAEILRSGRVNYWTGEKGREFEQSFSQYTGSKYGVALANGTVALELALKTLGVQAGDEVIVTPTSFVASASAIALQGATPVFADIDPVTMTISPDDIKTKITEKTRGIIAVHLLGHPCDMEKIGVVARQHNLFVVEDCAQAHGAKLKGQSVGTFGDISAFSFCQDKIISTGGEGGMLLTRNPEYWEFAWSFKDHGKNYTAMHAKDPAPGFRWVHDSLGTNWRMTEMQAAIGLIQLSKLDDWVKIRRRNAALLTQRLDASLIKRKPIERADCYHAYYKYTLQIDQSSLKTEYSRDRLVSEIQQEGVPCYAGICPEIYREKAFANFESETLPIANEVGSSTLQLLVDPSLTEENIDQMALTVNKLLDKATAS